MPPRLWTAESAESGRPSTGPRELARTDIFQVQCGEGKSGVKQTLTGRVGRGRVRFRNGISGCNAEDAEIRVSRTLTVDIETSRHCRGRNSRPETTEYKLLIRALFRYHVNVDVLHPT